MANLVAATKSRNKLTTTWIPAEPDRLNTIINVLPSFMNENLTDENKPQVKGYTSWLQAFQGRHTKLNPGYFMGVYISHLTLLLLSKRQALIRMRPREGAWI